MHHHVVSTRTNLIILFALLALTTLTVFVAFLDLGVFNTAMALGIAALKCTLVIWFFMHVKFASRLVRVGILSSIVMMLVLFSFVMADVVTRGWLGVPGK